MEKAKHSIILSKGKGNVAEGKGNIAEIELKNLFKSSISGTDSRVGLLARTVIHNITTSVYMRNIYNFTNVIYCDCYSQPS